MKKTAALAKRATILLGGDLCPIGRYEAKLLAGETVFDEILLNAFRKSDFSIVNLEAPLCRATLACANPGEKGLRADPRVAGFLKDAGITAAGLANNHIRDFGDAGYRETARALERHGIRHTGAGRNLAEAQQPLAVTVKGLRLGIWALAEKELNVAGEKAAGSSWFRPEGDAARIREMRKEFDFLLVYAHAGHEFMSTPSPRIRSAYRALVDAGADAVIGHHPHVVQGLEFYKGGLIAYSLGNLVFDSPYVAAHPDTDNGFLLGLDISGRGIEGVELVPYKLQADTRVTALTAPESRAFMGRMKTVSAAVTNDRIFEREWERNVKSRWNGEYRQVIAALASTLADKGKANGPRRVKNLITCPTHVELLGKAFDMMEAGTLPGL